MMILAILLPWLALLLRGHVLQGLLCLILQITVLGWVPAAIWAAIIISRDDRQSGARRYL